MRNAATEPIASVRVEVCGQVSEFGELLPEDEADDTFRVSGDSGYDVAVTFASGRELHSEVGYVTSGLDYDDVITVTESSIGITRASELENECRLLGPGVLRHPNRETPSVYLTSASS